jgi:hypothetical protein
MPNIITVTDKLQPRKPLIPLDLAKIKYVIVHHTGADGYTWEHCNHDHKNVNGWDAAGYNEYVYKNGDVYILRGDHIGAHCQGYNSTSYGIAVEGNYDKPGDMPTAQYNSLLQRIHYNLMRFPGRVTTMPHSAFYATVCPGRYFPLTKLLSEIKIADKELINALEVLQKAGVINSPNYWLAYAQPGKVVKGEYARLELLKSAEVIADLLKR